MTMVVDERLGIQLHETINRAMLTIERLDAENTRLSRNALMSEAEAMEYLRRDVDTLLYYRRLGLNFYKKGASVWYTKGDIDDWLASGKVNRHDK